eukprot:5109990-Amphidinium_carterae.1
MLCVLWFILGFTCHPTETQGITVACCDSVGPQGAHGKSPIAKWLVQDIVTLLALRFMQTAPKSLWPYGPGKIDSIAAL